MEFEKGEMKLLLAAALGRGPEGHARLSSVVSIFRRPDEARKIVGRLEGAGFVTVDTLGDKLRLLERPVLEVLGLMAKPAPVLAKPPPGPDQGQGELLVEERPLCEALAQVTALAPDPRGESAHPNVGTFDRSNVGTVKRSNVAAASMLRGKVKDLVGQADFTEHWANARYIWNNQERLDCLEKTLHGFTAGLQSGEITVRKTVGKAFWSYVRAEWEQEVKQRGMLRA